MILITGSNSYLGCKLLKRLLGAGNNIRCLDLYQPKDLPQGVEFFQGDVLDEIVLKKALNGVKTVFHFMDVTNPRKTGRRYMKRINVNGTKKILDAAKRAKVKRFFFLSSYEIYGKHKELPIRQDARKRPTTRYGRDKLKAEAACWAYIKSDMEVTIFRPAVICGPGIDDPIILITLFMALGMDDANRLYIAGDGDTRFQLLHPDDAVEAFMRAFLKDETKGKLYNLGSDNVPTQMELIVHIKDEAKLNVTIKHLTPKKTKILSFLLRPFKINYLTREHLYMLFNNILLDCQLAKKDLGWQPTKDNVQIITETIEWYKKEKL